MKKTSEKPRFQTHIQEPRWQQVLSVIGVAIFAVLWLWLAFAHVFTH